MKQTYRIRADQDIEEAQGIPTPLPGLVMVDLSDDPEEGFVLIHERSGTVVLHGHSPEALAVAVPLFAPFDWTMPGDVMKTDPGLWAARKQAIRLPGIFVPDADYHGTPDLP